MPITSNAVVKILVVEDESSVAKDIQNRLKTNGYDVTAIACSGEEAINKAAETYPDLVLMDIRIKGDMDGVEAARQIQTRFNVPIVYFSADADDNTLERTKLTPSGYLLKPFKERELYTAIEIALAKDKRERQLKESQQWLATILKSIGDAVIASDRKGAVTFMNPVAEALTGWKQSDAFGINATEVFHITHEKTRTPIESPVTKALHLGVTSGLSEQTILIAKNGTETPINHSVAPIKDHQGNITGAVLVFQDITERKRAESVRQKQTEQEQLIAELERLNQLKDEFLSTVSHELRTPLTNMKMALQMLNVSDAIEQFQRYVEILQTECNREIELINNLLDLQRLEAASSALFLAEAVSLQEWLPSFIVPFRTRTQSRQQTLQMHLPAELPPLISDRASLKRILAEHLNNACKYTPAGGEIILRVRYNSSSSATIFTISNSAEIPLAQLPRIFEKFYRVPNADPWKQGGTGLGLALVQKLVEQLHGSIQVESGEGWTTFTVELIPLVVATE